MKIRKALAWSACHKLTKFWQSKLPRRIKVRLFTATVESVLHYGSETWTLTQTLEKELDGCYTRMLRMALNVSWKENRTNQELYQNIQPVTTKIRRRRLQLAGHCVRHEDEVANQLIFWEPEDGN